MECKAVKSNCLFCVQPIVPYTILNAAAEETPPPGSGGDSGGEPSALSLIIPDFEVICTYLHVKFPLHCFKRRLGEEDDGGDQRSIFRAKCDKFLCAGCFEKVNLLRVLYRQLEEIKSRIKQVTKDVKKIILEGIEVEGNFAQVFENRVKRITSEVDFWKNEDHLKDACMEIKQEVEEGEIEVTEVDQPVEEFLVTKEDGPVTVELEDEEEGPEMNPVFKQLKAIAGEIVNREEPPPKDKEAEKLSVFQCPHCQRCYSLLKNLQAHITSNHSRHRKKIGTSRYSRDNLSLRVKSQVEIDGNIRYRCSFCTKLYEKVKALRNHIARNHPQGKVVTSKLLTCHLCPSTSSSKTLKTFVNQDRLQQHIFSSHTSGPKYKCPECSKAFCAKQSLKWHQDKDHKGIRYVCPDCPKYFTSTLHLKNHRKLAHLKEGIYKCPHCHREFARRCELKAHEIIHDPEAKRNHICESCGKEFLTRAGLSDHLKVHLEERKYACGYCPERFKKRSHLVAHERKHTGERPFGCEQCQRRFAVKSTLTQHLKVCGGGLKEPKKRGRKKKETEGGDEAEVKVKKVKKKKKKVEKKVIVEEGGGDEVNNEQEESQEENVKVVASDQIFAVL